MQGGGDVTVELSQWVNQVLGFSSEYAGSSKSIIGEPRVYPNKGRIIEFVWETLNCSGNNQWIEVKFDKPVQPRSVHIYETYNAGCVTEVQLRAGAGGWATAWRRQGETEQIEKSRIFSPDLSPFEGSTDSVRVELDVSRTASGCAYCDIDAIKLVGLL